MEYLLTLKKYFIEFDVAGLLSFRYQASWDITEHLLDSDLVIRKEVETGDTFNFSVPNVLLNFNDNDVMQEQFTLSIFTRYSFGLEISYNGSKRFIGEVDVNSIRFDDVQKTWQFSCRGWYKRIFDAVADIRLALIQDNVTEQLSIIFNTVNNDRLIQSKEIDVTNKDADWNIDTSIDRDLKYLLLYRSLTYQDLLIEMVKHYGAYIDITGDAKLRFLNRQRQNTQATVTITDADIIDPDLTKKMIKVTSYDGIIATFWQTGPPPWSSGYWICAFVDLDGTITLEQTAFEEEIYFLTKGKRLLDLRQKLSASPVLNSSGEIVTFIAKTDIDGYHIFPLRSWDDTLLDYYDLIVPPELMECKIQFNPNIEILDKIKYNDEDYIVESLEEDLIKDEMSLKLKKVATTTLDYVAKSASTGEVYDI